MVRFFKPAPPGAGFSHVRRLRLGPWPGVNVYLLDEPDGLTVVDTGYFWHGPTLERALAGRPVQRILLTHFHPDHSGGAAYLSRVTGAPVLVHPADYDFVAARRWLDEEPGWWVTRGMLTLLRWARLQRTAPPERLETFEEGDRFGEWEVMHTPGHTPGSVSFWNAERGLLMCGDNLVHMPWGLKVGVPFWTLDPQMQKRSLERYRELPVSVLLSGHGPIWRAEPPR